MSHYDAKIRAQLRASLVAVGTKPDRADQAVDLACHAADEAVEKLMTIIKSASDGAIGIMALEISAQLAASKLTGIFERLHALAGAEGLQSHATLVGD